MLKLTIDNILIHNMYNASVINAWSKALENMEESHPCEITGKLKHIYIKYAWW